MDFFPPGMPRRQRVARVAILVLLSALAFTAWALRRYEVVSRVGSWLDQPLPAVDQGPLANIRLVPAFDRLHFDLPVFVAEAPDGRGELYVVEQAGIIRRFRNSRSADRSEVFLDITPRVSRAGWEEGLLGLAFAPSFARSGRFYVYYSAKAGGETILSRFRLREDGYGDPSSEEVLLRIDQPYRNHNGGMIGFGPDRLLYIGVGDGGSGGDPHGHGQNPGTLLGTILRIDVEQTPPGQPYGVPPDNPFVGQANVRPEVWAYGLRNPWRFSWGRNGELWVGDVGQNLWEEVGVVPPGANCGWRAFEGFSVYDAGLVANVPHTPPLAAYTRSEGGSVTGGYVYRGGLVPELQGLYIYADFVSGDVWALDPRAGAEAPTPDPGEAARHPTAAGVRSVKLCRSGLHIASFGEDAQGELLACAFDGRIYRFERTRGAQR